MEQNDDIQEEIPIHEVGSNYIYPLEESSENEVSTDSSSPPRKIADYQVGEIQLLILAVHVLIGIVFFLFEGGFVFFNNSYLRGVSFRGICLYASSIFSIFGLIIYTIGLVSSLFAVYFLKTHGFNKSRGMGLVAIILKTISTMLFFLGLFSGLALIASIFIENGFDFSNELTNTIFLGAHLVVMVLICINFLLVFHNFRVRHQAKVEKRILSNEAYDTEVNYKCWEYFEDHICLSYCFPCIDYIINEIIFIAMGGYTIPSEKKKEAKTSNACSCSSLGGKVWGFIMKICFYLMGCPSTEAWNYGEPGSEGFPKIGKGRNEHIIKFLENFYKYAKNGDTIQMGGLQGGQITGVTRSSLYHCFVVIDDNWLYNRGGEPDYYLYQSTISAGTLNGVGKLKIEECLKPYIGTDERYWFFLLSLKDKERKKFEQNRVRVKNMIEQYKFKIDGKVTNARYSISTLLRDGLIMCYSSMFFQKSCLYSYVKNSEGGYDKKCKCYMWYKPKPNKLDILIMNFLNQFKNNPKYTACAKFLALIHQAGGLIHPEANVNHVTNDMNCWPDYFEQYYKMEIKPNIGQPDVNEYAEYLMDFANYSYEEYKDVLNGYRFRGKNERWERGCCV